MIGIIVAMNEEMNYIHKELKKPRLMSVADREFWMGKLNDVDVVIVKAGCGKVSAAVTTTLLLNNFPIKLVVNLGLAGGLLPAKQLDFVIASGVCYHDVDIFDYPYGQMQDMPLIFSVDEKAFNDMQAFALAKSKKMLTGIVATGDQFLTDSNKVSKICEGVKNIVAVEMESAAIAQTCYIHQCSFAAIKIISDVIDCHDQCDSYLNIKNEAAVACAKFFVEYLDFNNKKS